MARRHPRGSLLSRPIRGCRGTHTHCSSPPASESSATCAIRISSMPLRPRRRGSRGLALPARESRRRLGWMSGGTHVGPASLGKPEVGEGHQLRPAADHEALSGRAAAPPRVAPRSRSRATRGPGRGPPGATLPGGRTAADPRGAAAAVDPQGVRRQRHPNRDSRRALGRRPRPTRPRPSIKRLRAVGAHSVTRRVRGIRKTPHHPAGDGRRERDGKRAHDDEDSAGPPGVRRCRRTPTSASSAPTGPGS